MSTRMWRQQLLALPGVGVCLLPKLICPLCWPAYAGIMSALGLGFLASRVYLFPLTVFLLALASGSLAFRASRHRGFAPFGVGVAASATILIGKFYFDTPWVTYLSVCVLLVAAIWNAWPRRAAVSACARCIPIDSAS
jgi:hypothetical protein